MSQRFIKGKTNNHLSWVMVDGTDFASPESALSAATKIKIYGKTAGATGVNFVSSGTGSLTNDIQHVGASALGIYTIALAKADLSDASAAWYDQYIVSLSATGAAYQTLVVDGGIMESYLSDLLSDVSSYIIVMSGIQSDILSVVRGNSDMLSNMSNILSDLYSDFQSRVPKLVATNSDLVSQTSDLKSAIAAGPAATITASDMSDIVSRIWAAKYFGTGAHNVASSFGSAFRVQASNVSDIDSMLTAMSDILSNTNSLAILIQADTSNIASRITGAVATASDVASKVWAEKYTAAGNKGASTFGSLFDKMASGVSDTRSQVSDLQSDFQSRVPKLVATNSQLSQLHSDLDSTIVSQASDLKSAIAGVGGGTLTASDISDIVSAIWGAKYNTNSVASSFGSLFEKMASGISDTRSHVSDLQSDFQSRVPKAVATSSQAIVLQSDLKSVVTGNSDILSDIYALLSDLHSDVGVMSGIVSDIQSAVTSVGFKKNTAIADFEFLMVDSGDHITPKTGLTVTATRSLDGAAFGACANAVAELSNGIYVLDLAAADLNANIITFRFTAAGADDRFVTIKTQP